MQYQKCHASRGIFLSFATVQVAAGTGSDDPGRVSSRQSRNGHRVKDCALFLEID